MATITESFNKADSTTLGPDLTWTEISGDLQVVSNRCRGVSLATGNAGRADTDLSSSDHYAEIKTYIGTGGGSNGAGPIVRKDSTSTLTFYILWIAYGGGTYGATVYKVVASAFTAIGATVSLTYASGDVFRLEANGTTLTAYQNGSSIATRTDSAISTGLRCGLRLYAGSTLSQAEADDFAAADLAAATTSLVYFQPAIAPLLVR